MKLILGVAPIIQNFTQVRNTIVHIHVKLSMEIRFPQPLDGTSLKVNNLFAPVTNTPPCFIKMQMMRITAYFSGLPLMCITSFVFWLCP